ncbi:MAG: nitroreductase family protein [Bacteroidales bacterium]|nr:nitroreductase family protein [Bacteroidales bacterium]
MDAIETILTRRSIRKYEDKKVPAEVVKALLDAGMHAPTARNIQPWHFIVIDDRAILDQLSIAHPYAKMMKQASLAILVGGDRNLQEVEGYIIQDCSAVTQNIMLAAHAYGLGSVWLGMYPREQRMQDVGKILEIPEHILPVSLISIGYPTETVKPPVRYKEERVHFNKF